MSSTDNAVLLYRKEMSLRGVGEVLGVSQTTVARWLERAGEQRRGREEGNQRRHPREERQCEVCGGAFRVRRGHLRRGVVRGLEHGDLGLYCSRRCWDWGQRRRVAELAARTLTIEVVYR